MRIENRRHHITCITIERSTYPAGQGPQRLQYSDRRRPWVLIAGRQVWDLRRALANLWRRVRFLPPYPTTENGLREDQIL